MSRFPAFLVGGKSDGQIYTLAEPLNTFVVAEAPQDGLTVWDDSGYPTEHVRLERVHYIRKTLRVFGRPLVVYVDERLSEDEANEFLVKHLLSHRAKGLIA